MSRKRTDYSPAQLRQRALRLLGPVLRWSFKRKHQVCNAIRLGQLAEHENAFRTISSARSLSSETEVFGRSAIVSCPGESGRSA
jgi:hypothetical protein